MRSKRSNQSNALVLMVGTLASRMTGLVRSALLNQLFDSKITDAFITASRVPNLFRELLAEGALTNAFVPIYKNLSPEEGRKLSGALLALLFMVNALLLLLVVWAAPFIVSLLISDKGNIDFDLTVQLTRVVFPFLAALSFSALAMGILQAEERFFAPAWAPVALNIVSIIFMLLYPDQAVPLARAYVLGAAAQLLFQLPSLIRFGLVPKLSQLWHPSLAGLLILTIPSIFTTSGRQIVNLFASRILTGLSAGAPTAFFNADLFLSLVLGLFSISPAIAYYSRLSGQIEDKSAFAETLLSGLKFIAFLIVPAGFVLLFFAEPAIQTVLNWTGSVDKDVLRLSTEAITPLGLAVFPIGLSNLLLRSFYARKQVRTPIIVSLIFLSLQLILYTLLAPQLGIAGLSWATVLAAWVQLILYLYLVSRKENLNTRALALHASKVWLAAFFAGVGSFFLLGLINFSASWLGFALHITLAGFALFTLYAVFCYLLKVRELSQLLARFRP